MGGGAAGGEGDAEGGEGIGEGRQPEKPGPFAPLKVIGAEDGGVEGKAGGDDADIQPKQDFEG